MKAKILGLLAVTLLAGPIALEAAPITYIYSGTGSGTLAGNAFAADYVITAHADTSGVAPWAYASRQNTHTSATITISGLGTFDFVDATHTWVGDAFNQGGFGLNLSSNVVTVVGIGGYDLASSFGPLASASGYYYQTVEVATSGGVLIFSSLSGTPTFEARLVPEPGTLALLGLGLAGLGLSRRRLAA